MTNHASLTEFKSCSIGTSLNEKCKRTIEDLKDISDFDDEKRKLLMLHCSLENISSICDYHEPIYLGKFISEHGKYCCDLFNKCSKRVKGMPYRKLLAESFIMNFSF